MGIKIEKGVAMASVTNTAGRPPKYPFAALEISDSFAIDERDLNSARSQSSRMGKLLDRTFTIGRDESGNWRAWRTE